MTFVLLVLAVLLVRDDSGKYVNSPLSEWYSVQHNKVGNFCCDKADAHDFYGSYQLDSDGSVEFAANGTHYHLSSDLVLSGPNPTGHAVWWYAEGKGWHNDYCFALGPEG